MSRVVKVESVSQLHEFFGYEKPKHPLVTLIANTQVDPAMFAEDMQVITGFYSVTFKNGHECEVKYGRQYYDFQEGSLMFLAPGQSIFIAGNPEKTELTGWTLFFHPDLIRKSHLGKNKMPLNISYRGF